MGGVEAAAAAAVCVYVCVCVCVCACTYVSNIPASDYTDGLV